MNHEPISIAQIVAHAAERNSEATANTAVVIGEAISDILYAYREGRLTDEVPSEEDRLAEHFRKQVKSTIRGGTSIVRTALETGQALAALGDDFDVTVTVCGPRALKSLLGIATTAGRTTTTGNLTADDIDLTVEELRLSYQSQKSAYYTSRETGGLWVAQLRRLPSYRAWQQTSAAESA